MAEPSIQPTPGLETMSATSAAASKPQGALNISSFLSEGKQIPQGSALTATQSQTVLPDFYTDYARQLLANQQALSQQPFQLPPMPRVAEFSPTQQAAFDMTGQAATAYQPLLNLATQNALTSGNASPLAAATPLFQQALKIDQSAPTQYAQQAAGMSSLSAASPLYQAALGVNQNDAKALINQAAEASTLDAAMPFLQRAGGITQGAAGALINQAAGMSATERANPLIDQALAVNNDEARSFLLNSAGNKGFAAASPFLQRAADIDVAALGRQLAQTATSGNAVAMASPYFSQAMAIDPRGVAGQDFNAARGNVGRADTLDIVGAARPLLDAAATPMGMNAAAPYLQAGAQRATDVSAYMNPFVDQVAMRAGELGARTLRDQLLPEIEGRYIRSGQLGMGPRNPALAGTPSGQMTDTVRALRDIDDNVRAQQSDLMMRGYTQAQAAAQTDLARQVQLAQTAGDLGTAQQNTLTNIGRTFGDLTGQQQQAYLNSSAAMTNIGRANADVDLARAGLISNIGSQVGQLADADAARSIQAAGQVGELALGQQRSLADLASTAGGLTTADRNADINTASQLGALSRAQQEGILSAASQLGNLTSQDAARLLDAAQRQAAITQSEQDALFNIANQVGKFTEQDAQRQLAAAQELGNLNAEQQAFLASLGTNVGNLTTQDANTLLAASGRLGDLNAGQQSFLTGLGGQVGSLTNLTNQTNNQTTQQLAELAQLSQQLGLTGAGALQSVGDKQQAQAQANLDAAYADFLRQQAFPQQQIDASLKTFQGVAPGVPTGSQTAGIVPTGQPAQFQPGTAATIAGGLTGVAGILSALGVGK